MTDFENDEIKHQIYFEQYKTGQVNKILALLETANKRIASKIKETKGVYTKARYNELMKYIQDVSDSLKDAVKNGTDIDGVIEYELHKQLKLMSDLTVFDDLVFPTLEQLKTAVFFAPVLPNMTYQSYLESISTGLYNIWDSHIRTGYLTGQTTQSIVKDVLGSVTGNAKLIDKGAMATLKKSVTLNTRTVLQAFASNTRDKIYQKNEKLIKGYKWLATLDSRTCKVCMSYDGKVEYKREDMPVVPIHQNCRCTVLCVFEDSLSKTRASKNGYVDATLDYNDWLKTQPDEFQKEVLGASRYKLFKSGVNIGSFVENGKVLTLKQLKDKLE